MNVPFAASGQRVRDQLLVILSEEFPLTVKELYNRISKQGHEVSYQAVHKVVLQLQEEGIIEKKGKGMQLHQTWIHRVKDYAFNVDMAYTTGKKYLLPKTFDKPFTIVFDDYSNYVLWIATNARDGKLFSTGKPGPFFGMFRHALWPLRFNFMDFELLREMAANCPTQGFCTCDMPFDKWISAHYSLGGIKEFRTGVKMQLDDDYFVAGDNVIRATYSKETQTTLDNIYSKIKDLKQLFQFYFSEANNSTPARIEVTVANSPTMARMIESKVRHHLTEATKKS